MKPKPLPGKKPAPIVLKVFKDDQAIRRYCKRNYMDKPKIISGMVSVYDEFRNERHVVGVMG